MSVTTTISRVKALRKIQESLRKAQRARNTPPVRITDHWTAHAGPQREFCESTCREILYGGAAGGGKSAAIVAIPLKWVHRPNFSALILRRKTTQLGNLLEKTRLLYRKAVPKAKLNETSHKWRFPSGSQLWMNHCEHDDDAFGYQGEEFQYVAFDELTHFTKKQYLEISSRVRGTDRKLPRFIRSTSNPGGPGHEWVFERFGAWLNPDYEVEGMPKSTRLNEAGERLPPAEPGQILWFVKSGSGEKVVPEGTWKALSRTFIPARLEDNPTLAENDPSYEAQLDDNDPVRRAQLRDGNWLVKAAAGLLFKKSWFADHFLDAVPAGVRWIRYWDLAASPKGDWAVGVKFGRLPGNGAFVVAHVERLRGNPGDIKAQVRTTAELDGKEVAVWIEQDPGQAGKDQVHTYVTQNLVGWTVHGRVKRANKLVAAGPVSAQCSAGNMKLVRGTWNGPFLDCLEAFPDGDHDDDVDALSGAFAAHTKGGSNKIVTFGNTEAFPSWDSSPESPQY